MRRCDDKRSSADQVASLAVDPSLAGWEARDSSAILKVLGVAKQHYALDLVLYSSTETGNSVRHDCSALRVATCSDGRVGALARSKVEETLGFADGGLRSTGWKRVLCDTSSVWAAYTLNPGSGCSICAFESVGCERTN